MLYLKALNTADTRQEYHFFQEIQSESGFLNPYHGISYSDFVHQAVPERIDASRGIGVAEGLVPDTYFFLWEDTQIVGLFKIRHYLNDFLKKDWGHLAYAILPEYRGRGYGTKGLALAVEVCKGLLPPGEDEIYLSCYLDNTASLRVMLKNGATIHHHNSTDYFTRIKIR